MRPKPERLRRAVATVCLMCLILATAASCSKPPAQAAAGPPVVEVVPVVQKDVPIYSEWIGTLDGMVNAAITAQVTGYLRQQLYTEGSFVTKGQILFEIDPRPFQTVVDETQGQLAQAYGQLAQAKAQVQQSKAQLASAEANQVRTQLDVNRYIPLAKQQAITQQDLDNATQNNLAAKAQVQAAKAAVETAIAQVHAATATVVSANAALEAAKVNLGFTKLKAPIDGIAGLAQQQVGALVSPSSGPVTTVSTVDPIKVYFTVTEQEYLNYVKRFPTRASREANEAQSKLQLILANEHVYPRNGRFFFADRQVDPTTGAIRMAALFPNPGNLLRPGLYGRVRAETDIHEGALLVPQRAVTELQGSYQVAVVGNDNKIKIQPVQVGQRTGSMWIIDSGLQPGERVVAEGVQKVRPGVEVNPKPLANNASL